MTPNIEKPNEKIADVKETEKKSPEKFVADSVARMEALRGKMTQMETKLEDKKLKPQDRMSMIVDLRAAALEHDELLNAIKTDPARNEIFIALQRSRLAKIAKEVSQASRELDPNIRMPEAYQVEK